jgi:hypothetical protein
MASPTGVTDYLVGYANTFEVMVSEHEMVRISFYDERLQVGRAPGTRMAVAEMIITRPNAELLVTMINERLGAAGQFVERQSHDNG